MKRFLLFTWQDDVCNGGRECVQAGWNSFRNSYDSAHDALLAFHKDYENEDHGQCVDTQTLQVFECEHNLKMKKYWNYFEPKQLKINYGKNLERL